MTYENEALSLVKIIQCQERCTLQKFQDLLVNDMNYQNNKMLTKKTKIMISMFCPQVYILKAKVLVFSNNFFQKLNNFGGKIFLLSVRQTCDNQASNKLVAVCNV